MNREGMKKEQTAVLQVRMFGGFSMTYAGEKITFARSNNKKFIQLLELLFLNFEDGIKKREVLDALYAGADDAADNKNLNNVIYRLKKQLVLAGLPEGEDYIRLKKGVIRWTSSFPVEIDMLRMEALVKEAEGLPKEEQMERLQQAAAVYTGELLPEVTAESWVVGRNQQYKHLYERVILELGAGLEAEARYEEAEKLYRKAAELYPADEWQLKVMDCLLERGQCREAQEIYREAVRFFCEEMGLPPGGEMLKRLRRIEEQMIHPTGNFTAIREQIREKESSGAYYCLLPSFIDSCRIITRVAERSGQSVFLMLLTLGDSRGKLDADPERQAVQMEKLKETIRMVLRRGDLYTRCSKNQYLIILIGTEQENCQKAFARLQDAWKRKEGHKGTLSYTAESLLQVVDDSFTKQEQQPSWGKKGTMWT